MPDRESLDPEEASSQGGYDSETAAVGNDEVDDESASQQRKSGSKKANGPDMASSGTEFRQPRQPEWPTHNAPRAWLITDTNSPVGTSLCRHLLAHGDYVAAGVLPQEFDREQDDRSAEFKELLEEVGRDADKASWRARLRPIALDVRVVGQCQSAVAEAVRAFGRIDVLFCCQSETVVGSIEELGQDQRAFALVQDQFETNFFGSVNIIKAALPSFRAAKNGHILLLTAITGHLGTPGLGVYCASQWAIEGYCDSIAYEIAPFNVKMTIIQPNMEVAVLTNCITSAPPMTAYSEDANPAPLSRKILSGILDRLEGADEPTLGDNLYRSGVTSITPPLGRVLKERLVAETVHAVAAIGGHDNPPARHIVGSEAVASVRTKLKTVSEELEEFVECSAAVDVEKDAPAAGT